MYHLNYQEIKSLLYRNEISKEEYYEFFLESISSNYLDLIQYFFSNYKYGYSDFYSALLEASTNRDKKDIVKYLLDLNFIRAEDFIELTSSVLDNGQDEYIYLFLKHNSFYPSINENEIFLDILEYSENNELILQFVNHSLFNPNINLLAVITFLIKIRKRDIKEIIFSKIDIRNQSEYILNVLIEYLNYEDIIYLHRNYKEDFNISIYKMFFNEHFEELFHNNYNDFFDFLIKDLYEDILNFYNKYNLFDNSYFKDFLDILNSRKLLLKKEAFINF